MLCYRGFRIDFIQVPLLTGSQGPYSPNGVVLGKFHKTKAEGIGQIWYKTPPRCVAAGSKSSPTSAWAEAWQKELISPGKVNAYWCIKIIFWLEIAAGLDVAAGLDLELVL